MMIDTDALISTADAHDDIHNIDHFELIALLAHHIREIADDKTADDFLLSYDICPKHECDIQICADDNEPECAHLRH